ncbi:MAG: hypothetical protein IJB84_02890 [Lachnospiraceae bacterium]|nr:hypothetical protein [Lachnospiraceae bacterium]
MTKPKEKPLLSVKWDHKSRMFTMIFSRKEELLELYNAVSGKHYTNPEALEINTLENAIYMSMSNDLSFIIDSRLSLYEHQSTYCPNLPIRFFQYLSDIYSPMIKDKNIYGTKKIMLPAPHFIVFYNGLQQREEIEVLKLSDLYEVQEEEVHLELKVVMININRGNNQKLMDTCRTLKDYAEFVYGMREYAKEIPIEVAAERAITECIREGILKEFLEQNRAEAMAMSIYEYDEEKHIRMEREDAYADGHKDGHKAGFEDGLVTGALDGQNRMLTLVQKMMEDGMAEKIPQLTTQDFLEEMLKRYEL